MLGLVFPGADPRRIRAIVPPEIQALGRALQCIMEGLRGEETLAELPAEFRPPVEELLRWIE
jgi:hypothetical protein